MTVALVLANAEAEDAMVAAEERVTVEVMYHSAEDGESWF